MTPDTLADLLDRWARRDELYAQRKRSGVRLHLTNEEVGLIRAHRRYEALNLPNPAQRLALGTLASWPSTSVA